MIINNSSIIIEETANGNTSYRKDSSGREYWYDDRGNKIHMKHERGPEVWWTYNILTGNLTHYKSSNGFEQWYDEEGNITHTIELDKN